MRNDVVTMHDSAPAADASAAGTSPMSRWEWRLPQQMLMGWDGLPVWVRSIAAGLLMGLSFPPFDLPILQIPAWMALIRLIHPDSVAADGAGGMGLRRGGGAGGDVGTGGKGRHGVIRTLYPAMLTWNIIATYWLMMATFAGGLAANLANALVMTLPFAAIRAVLDRRWGPLPTTLAVAAVWTGFEFFHHRWDLSWPWLTLGNAWAVWPSLIQWIGWTGHLGITFWVVLVSTWAGTVSNVGVGGSEESRSSGSRIRRWTGAGGWRTAMALFLVMPVSSLAILRFQDVPGGSQDGGRRDLTVTVIQPDQNSLLPNGGHGSLNALLDELVRQTDAQVTIDTDLILWPENALDGAVTLDSEITDRLQQAVDRWDASLITGAVFVETYPEGAAPRLSRGSNGRTAYNIYNAALHLQPGGNGSGRIYKKANLVPVVERFPFVDALSGLPLLDRIDWTRFMGYGKGETANAFDSGEGYSFPTLICYDSVYPDWIRRFPMETAGVLVVITNDGWWGDTSGHTQHFEYARLRAIEFGRVVVRSANNGISGIILPDGSVEHLTPYASRTGFSRTVQVTQGLTFYARHGNWLGWSAFAVFLAGIALSLADRIRRIRRAVGASL